MSGAPAALASSPPDLAKLAGDVEQLRTHLNHVWVMTAAALVLLMQAGSCCLKPHGAFQELHQRGAKNVVDFFVSAACFAVFGFMVMFGRPSRACLARRARSGAIRGWMTGSYTYFVFQVAFAGSADHCLRRGAERMSYAAYIVLAAVVGLLIYPVFGHWAWGAGLITENKPWLAAAGFIDFAGSTTVHSVGPGLRWPVSLFSGRASGLRCQWQGPADPWPFACAECHRCDVAAGRLDRLQCGFHGCCQRRVGKIAANTLLGASFGGIVAMLIGRAKDGTYLTNRLVNGLLAGLVGITAGCDAVGSERRDRDWCDLRRLGRFCRGFRCHRMKLDDVAGVVGVHGISGVLGTLLVPFFAMTEKLNGMSVMSSFLVQLQGVGAAFVWAFGMGLLTFWAMKVTIGIRLSEEDELRA